MKVAGSMMTEKSRWQIAQKAENSFWDDFGPSPRHFSREYWDWELIFLGLDLQCFKELPICNILEVGCGPFGMIHFIDIQGGVKIGVEPLAIKLKKMGYWNAERITHIAAMGEELPVGTETMDFVICFNVLDHVLVPEKILAELGRVLRPQGMLLFNIDTIRPVIKPLKLFLSKMDKPHPFHWTAREVLQLLHRSGFEILYGKSLPRNNYRFSWWNFLNSVFKPSSNPESWSQLRVGRDKYIPATGSVFRHIGSNMIHMRLDIRAEKRSV
jgi:SAM-dependent methyltransferase